LALEHSDFGEQSAGSCVAYQLGKCKGACVGKEPLMLHNARLQMALSSLKLKPWPFPGRVALQEGRFEYHVLDHWMYLGTARFDEELAELASTQWQAGFDVDVYRILVRFLAKNPKIEWHDLRDSTIRS
jgi:DNA polymerase-3 subunit epsilon